MPGFDDYSITKDLGQDPKYTMIGKGNIRDFQNRVTGLGQYTEKNAIYVKNASWKIGTGTRGDDLRRVIKEGVHGPGI